MKRRLPESIKNTLQWLQLRRVQAWRVTQVTGKKLGSFLNQYPFPSFLGTLAILVALVVAGNAWRKPTPAQPEGDKPAVSVETLHIGGTPVIETQGTVQQNGVIQLNSLSGGVVQKLNVKDGSTVRRGQSLVSLSASYAGGSPQNISRQIAEKNTQSAKDNLPTQLELIAKRRSLAQGGETQAWELRNIARQSLDDTRAVIQINEELLNSVNSQLSTLEATNVGGVNDATIQQLKQSKAGLLSGLSSLRSGLRNAEYQGNEDQEPAQMARTSRDLTVQQLELEERGLKLGVEIAELNLKLARLSESLLYPASPCDGRVERLFVRFGQSVNPGQHVASIVCAKTSTQVVVLTSQSVASRIARGSEASVVFGDQTVTADILSVSTQPTDGALHSIILKVVNPPAQAPTDGSFVSVKLPTTGSVTTASAPFVPLDAVFQTQTTAFVYVAEERDGQKEAHLRSVTLGPVFGSEVEVTSGLQDGDQVILNRTISSGDRVEIKE